MRFYTSFRHGLVFRERIVERNRGLSLRSPIMDIQDVHETISSAT